jgi:histidine ammonia-lyase
MALHGGRRVSGKAAMDAAGIARLVPAAKEGLAVTNGAQLSTAILALACVDAVNLVYAAEIAAALSFEALRGVTRALDPAVMALRPYRGAMDCAADLRALLAGSTLTDSLADKVQDAYALRCTPQILGACRDGVRFAMAQAKVEMNAATDNPLVLVDAPGANKAFSAGMFHGEPVGMAADHLKLAASEVAALAERRLFRLTTGTLSSRLPPLLADRPGLGMMVPQSTAAALVSENKALLWPASGDSIPTCEDQEDHVAMATTATRRAAEVVGNSVNVVAIELLCAARGARMRLAEGGRVGVGTLAALVAIEDRIGAGGEIPARDIEALASAILDGSLARAVQAASGPLQEVGC